MVCDERLTHFQTGAIDDVHRASMAASDPETQAEGKSIVAEIGKLKYEMQHDRALTYESPGMKYSVPLR